MRKGLSKVIILGWVFIWGPSPGFVLSEEPNPYSSPFPKSSRKIVEEFLSQGEDFNLLQGRVPISRMKKIFGDPNAPNNVQALHKQFEEDCLKGKVAPSNALSCSKAVITLGVVGRAGTENTIMSFLKTNKNSVASVRKAGLFALGYLGNAEEHKRQKEISFRGMETPEFAPSPPITPSPPAKISKENIPEKIIKCLPQAMRSNFRLSIEEPNSNLCDIPWEVKNPNDRDEIRWGLINLAKTGSTEARQILEDLIQSDPGTSRYAFIQELIKLHSIASDEYGLLCLNEPENSVCQ